jgi:hypothetical protein
MVYKINKYGLGVAGTRRVNKYAPKFPIILITPKMSPFFERMVMYEPCALPGTGAASAAAVSSSYIRAGLPILGLVA